MSNWDEFFHFKTGTKFYIDGPYGYNGHGKVLENSPSILTFEFNLEAWGPAPEMKGSVSITYAKEGPGNLVIFTPKGKSPLKDDNAVIISNSNDRERSVSSKQLTFSVRHDGKNEIDFDAYINGKNYDFDFIKN